MPRSKVSELLLKEQGVIKNTELGCQADDGLGVLVHKIMASQVHVVGDGCGFADMNCQFLAGIKVREFSLDISCYSHFISSSVVMVILCYLLLFLTDLLMSCMFAIADSRSCSCASVWSHTTWFYPNGTLTSNPEENDLKCSSQMLCEDRGFFLEIADFIRGLGLTILKGVMEARKNKVWARFAVEVPPRVWITSIFFAINMCHQENKCTNATPTHVNFCILCAQANRDMTRMEIFLSLVQLLEPASESVSAPSSAAANINTAPTAFHQTKVTARVV
ncbi:hypothetical protein GW17_00042085 [Ensete ventricosum]|nr:hypothetical protein GW17_00042085 [Ensete ventricosum]